jgi:hypothetical protein
MDPQEPGSVFGAVSTKAVTVGAAIAAPRDQFLAFCRRTKTAVYCQFLVLAESKQ